MFKNPLKKYQPGGQMSTEEAENQMAQVLAEAFQMDPQVVKARIQEIRQNPEESKLFAQGLQMLQQGDQQNGMAIIGRLFQVPSRKQGGKINSFICKHAKGGHVAGCGCGNKVPKGEMGVVIRPTSYNRANGLRFVERQYTPDGQAVYTMATSRETLPSNMLADPYSEYSQNGGEYQGNGQVQIIDNGKGNLRVLGNPYGPTDEGLQHGQDSVNYVNRLRELAKKANIKLGPSFQENGGVVKGQGGIPEGMPNPKDYWVDHYVDPSSTPDSQFNRVEEHTPGLTRITSTLVSNARGTNPTHTSDTVFVNSNGTRTYSPYSNAGSIPGMGVSPEA